MGARSGKLSKVKQLRGILASVPQYISTHAVEVGLIDSNNDLVVSYSTAANQDSVNVTFEGSRNEALQAMLRTVRSFASTLSKAAPDAVHLVGKDHIVFVFPLGAPPEQFLLVIWIECLATDDETEIDTDKYYQQIMDQNLTDLLGVVRHVDLAVQGREDAHAPNLMNAHSSRDRDREKDKEKDRERDKEKEKDRDGDGVKT